jgi:hypothetical protein
MRLRRDYFSYPVIFLLVAIVLLAPVQVFLVLSQYSVFGFYPYPASRLFSNGFMGLNSVIYVVPVDTSVMFLTVLKNIHSGISRDVEKGYSAIHFSASGNPGTSLAAELVSTSVIPYTLLFVTLSLFSNTAGFSGDPVALLAVYLLDFLPVLLFFSMMLLIAMRKKDRAFSLFSGFLYLLIFLSLSYIIPMAVFLPAVVFLLLGFGVLVPGYLTGINYIFTKSYPTGVVIITPMKHGILQPTPFINFGFIEMAFVLNVIINIALLIMVFRCWRRNFGIFD